MIIRRAFSDLKSLNKIVFSFLICCLLFSCSGKKLGYVDINQLYESFEYKKKLTKEFNVIKSARQRMTDSLELELNQMASYIEANKNYGAETETKFQEKKAYFFQLSKQFEEDNQVLMASYNEKILKQLNAYIKEFGKKNAYELIVGADNKGSVLYGDEKLDITTSLLEFVNERYKGENKVK